MNDNTNNQNFIKTDIEEVKPGMKIGKDIESDFGGVLIPEGTILDQYKIERLKKLGLENLYIYK